MRNMYVFEGIDKQRTLEDAAAKSVTDGPNSVVIVHLHRQGSACQEGQHYSYIDGEVHDKP